MSGLAADACFGAGDGRPGDSGILKTVAKRIQENTSYPAYRIGGDEFVILVDEEVEEARYKQFKKNIDQAFAQRVRCLDKKLHGYDKNSQVY